MSRLLSGLFIGLLLPVGGLFLLAFIGWLMAHPGWFWGGVGVVAMFLVVGLWPSAVQPRPAPGQDNGPKPIVPRPDTLHGRFRPEPGNHAANLRLKRVAARWRFRSPPR